MGVMHIQMYGRADGKKEKAFKTSNNKCSSRQQYQPSSSSSPICAPITKKRRLHLHANDTVNGHLLAPPNHPVDITIDTRCPSPLTTSISIEGRPPRHPDSPLSACSSTLSSSAPCLLSGQYNCTRIPPSTIVARRSIDIGEYRNEKYPSKLIAAQIETKKQKDDLLQQADMTTKLQPTTQLQKIVSNETFRSLLQSSTNNDSLFFKQDEGTDEESIPHPHFNNFECLGIWS